MGKVIIIVAVLCGLAACQKHDDNTAERNAAGGVVVRATVTTRPARPEFVMNGLNDGGLADVNTSIVCPPGPSGPHAISVPGPKSVRNGRDTEICFVRLEHGGKAWNDGMTTDTGRADQNFLEYLHDVTGIKIRGPESISIVSLKLYKKGQAPPFVYLTGQSLADITTSERKALRQYCLGGGLIFADGDGGSFDTDFRRLMREVFPDQPLADIPNDDLIFREPYAFPDGAPTLWGQSRVRASGVRAPGTSRLCVFYYPGNLHDAWKSGHSGLSADKTRGAYKFGLNVVSYAYTHHLDMHK